MTVNIDMADISFVCNHLYYNAATEPLNYQKLKYEYADECLGILITYGYTVSVDDFGKGLMYLYGENWKLICNYRQASAVQSDANCDETWAPFCRNHINIKNCRFMGSHDSYLEDILVLRIGLPSSRRFTECIVPFEFEENRA